MEWAQWDIRVNMVSPGSILEDGNTWGRQRDAGSERYKKTLARNPMGRPGPTQTRAVPLKKISGRGLR